MHGQQLVKPGQGDEKGCRALPEVSKGVTAADTGAGCKFPKCLGSPCAVASQVFLGSSH